MELARRALDAIHRHALLPRGGRVVVALSGGSDSVALLRLLRELESAGELVVAGVAHLNHGLRETAHRDEQFCRALAMELGVPFRSDLVDVRGRAHTLGISLEDAGRRARYELFARVATECQADAVATGHTRDDQAETFLLRLIRGAGPRGLGGIHPKVGGTVRPLLDIGRDELRAYLADISQGFCEDESNSDISIPRNRIRHTLLPLLTREFSPGIVDVLAREAAIARDDEDRLQSEAIDLLGSIVLEGSGRLQRGPQGLQPDTPAPASETVELNARALSVLHPALRTRVARLVLAMLAPDRFVGFEHVERLLGLADGSETGTAVALPGQYASRQGEVLVLSRKPFAPFANSFEISLSIPGEATAGEWVVTADTDQGARVLGRDGGQGARGPEVERAQGAREFSVAARADRLTSPLMIRSRRPGDRFRPAGMGGRARKVQDVLVDRKVPRQQRDFLPLVVDSAGTIVWIVGGSVAEDFRVTGASQGVIFLKARRLGGQG